MDSTVRGFKMWPLAVLTDDRINKGFFARKHTAAFLGWKKWP